MSNPATGAHTASTPFMPNHVRYDGDDWFSAEFVADMRRESPLAPWSENGRIVLRYDSQAIDLRKLVAARLADIGLLPHAQQASAARELERLHELVPADAWTMDSSQQSAAARALYEMPTGFEATYHELLRQMVREQLGTLGPVHYQRTPTFRVFFPDALGYPGETTFHSDIMLGHNPREINVFVPLVRCEGSRSLLLADLDESLTLMRDYGYDFARFGRDTQLDRDTIARCHSICHPLEVEVGDVVVFDSRCLHAGPPNETPWTRVTMDARIVPATEFATQRNRYRGLGRKQAEFVAGEYFSRECLGP